MESRGQLWLLGFFRSAIFVWRLCASVLLRLGHPSLRLGFCCELETTCLSLPASVLHCQPLPAAMRIPPQLAAFLLAKLLLGGGGATECMLPSWLAVERASWTFFTETFSPPQSSRQWLLGLGDFLFKIKHLLLLSKCS